MIYLWFGIGLVTGSIVTTIIWYIRSHSGTFKIDRSNPNKDVCRLELEQPLDKIYKKKHLILKIDSKADLSQK